VLEEVSIVADDQEGACALLQGALQPEDALDVQVVGRLVHQDDVGRRRQLAGDGEPLPPAAGQRVDADPTVDEPGPAARLREPSRSILVIQGGQGGEENVVDGEPGVEERILGHVPDANAATKRAGPPIGAGDTGQDLQQGGLAGAVGTDEARLVALEQSERQIVEERPGPVRFGDTFTAEQQRSRHPDATSSSSSASSFPSACSCLSPSSSPPLRDSVHYKQSNRAPTSTKPLAHSLSQTVSSCWLRK
jgi:hypothetical protein